MIPLIDGDVLDLLEQVKYEDGGLYWVKPKGGRTLGRRVGSTNGLGYRQFTFKYKIYLEHRVIWWLFRGEIPAGLQIDHIDRNPGNNVIENLRAVSASSNQLNKGKGYSYDTKTGRYRSKYHPTKSCGKQTTISIGYFDTAQEAMEATAAFKENLIVGRERRMRDDPTN